MPVDPLTIADAGFAPGYEKRHPLRTDEFERAKIRRAAIKALRGTSSECVFPEIPAGFVDPQVAKLATHLRHGHWEKARETLDDIERLWAEYQAEQQPVRELMWPDRIRAQVNRLGLPLRVINVVESVTDGTIGSLRDEFPAAFVDLPNVGSETVRMIAAALVRAEVISQEEAERAFREWADKQATRGLR